MRLRLLVAAGVLVVLALALVGVVLDLGRRLRSGRLGLFPSQSPQPKGARA